MFSSLKRIFAGSIALAMVAGAVAFPANPAAAQERTRTNAPGGWGSAVLIQNVGTATLTPDQYSIDFYNASGTLVKSFTPPSTASIAPGASREFYIPSAIPAAELPAGQYSGVVSSSVPVKAVVNTSTNAAAAAPWSAFAYEGVDASATSTRLFFPGFYKDYFGFRSELVVQNTGTSAATVRATFYRSSDGQAFGPFDLGSIQPSASQTFAYNDSAFASLPGGTNTSLFGVVIESTNSVPLAGVSNIWTADDNDAGVGSFNAFTGGTPRVYTAALYNNYFGFVASLTIQNLGTATAAGNINFSDGTVTPFSVPANQAREFYLPNIANLGSGNQNGLLSAEIVGGSSDQIVALVNIQRKNPANLQQPNAANPALGSYGSTSTSATRVRVPAIFNDYFGFFTAVTVRNAGTAPATITLRYGDNRTWVSPTIDPGKTFNFEHLPGKAGNVLDGAGIQIGGTIESGQPVVVVVQHNSAAQLPSFNAAKFSTNDFLFALSGFPE